ncbi:MAG: hypothetical protein LBC12_00660 [Nitrososphaerota archaeon]|nr:hypothetical protein [Nitrososphaerota archaeon]
MFEKRALCCWSSLFCLIILLNLPLSAEKQHSERLRLKYCFKKEVSDATILSKISRRTLILRKFFLEPV